MNKSIERLLSVAATLVAIGKKAKCMVELVKMVTFPKFKQSNQLVLKYPFVVGE